MNFSEYHQLESYYTNKLLNITKDLKLKATVWQGIFKNTKKLILKSYTYFYLNF
jgi:hypothetical protein